MQSIFPSAFALAMLALANPSQLCAAEANTGRGDPTDSAKESVQAMESLRIVALGDSITNGVRLVGVQEAETFRAIVQRELTARLGRPIEVINAGVNGDIATHALERLEPDVLDRKPDVVTIMFGGNDGGFYRPQTNDFADTPRVPRDQFQAAVDKLVDRLQAARIEVVLMTSPPMTQRYGGAHLEPYRRHGINFLVEQYAQAVRDVAARRQVPLVDVYQAFIDNPAQLDLFPDGLHPNARGHRVIADLLVPRLVQLIEPNRRSGESIR